MALAQTRSFGQAAQLRNVTQPAFGRRIKSLEEWLGAPLIDRAAYPTQLTEAGQQFLHTAREVCRSLDDARASFSPCNLPGNTLRIATGRTLGHTLFPEWLIKPQRRLATTQPPSALKADLVLAPTLPNPYCPWCGQVWG